MSTNELPDREQDIFAEALDIASPEARLAFLDQACAGDAALRARVDELLQAIQSGESFLANKARVAVVTEKPGDRIGRYKLLEQIGEGGWGVVYLAEQQEPVRRRVALKVIKLGMDTRSVIARFEAERQALAMMDHPNIARVLDAGATDAGRPYFVMELVCGVRITEYCDDNQLPTEQRLQLFLQVCQAIQHAHQKGIIHRDIKPSNILVTLHDGVPVPKVIDFGIAKATDQRLTEKTLFTSHGQVIGTPAYMSPEQAETSGLDIDTRSDIYSLGVLLYELLVGQTPFDGQELMRIGLQAMQRTICEQEPARPSTRLRALTAAALTTTAQRRHTAPAKLAQRVQGDLDWIVMKALAKERERRYGTATDFAADIQHHLSNEPVVARPLSTAYRLGKIVRRHRFACLAAAVVLAVLVAGIAATSWQAVRATRAEHQAKAEAGKSQWAVQFISNTLSSVKGLDATLLKDFLDNASNLVGTNSTEQIEIKAEIRQAIRDAHRTIEQAREVVPYVQNDLALREAALKSAQAQYGLGHSNTWNAMFIYAAKLKEAGRVKEALPLMEEVLRLRKANLGPDHPDTLDSMNGFAASLQDAGRLSEAIPMYEETLKLRRAKLGPDDSSVLTSMNNLGRAYDDVDRLDEAIALLRDAVQLSTAKRGAEDLSTLNYKNNLALACHHAGRVDEARPLFEEVFAARKSRQGADHPSTLSVMNNLASAYADAHRWGDAVALNEQALNLRKAKLGPNHPATLVSMNNLAADYRQSGRIADAIRIDDEALKLRQTKLGDDHPLTLASMHNLASDYKKAGQPEKAMSLLTNALQLAEAKLGPGHSTTLTILNAIASTHHDARRLDEATVLYEELLRRALASLGTNHPSTLVIMNNLAGAYGDAGRHVEAVSLFEQTLQQRRATLSPNHPNILFSTRRLAEAYQSAGRQTDADALWAEVAKLKDQTNAPAKRSTALSGTNTSGGFSAGSDYRRADALYRAGKFSEAEPLYRIAIQSQRVATTSSNEYTLAYAASLARCLTELAWAERSNSAPVAVTPLERAQEAERLLRECLAIRQRGTNANSWRVADVNSRLGFALATISVTDATLAPEVRLTKLAEAEPLLLESAAALQAARGVSTDYIRDSLSRLIRLYEAWSKPAQAAEWRQKLEAFDRTANRK